MDQQSATPQLDRKIFWDVDYDKLDFGKRSRFIIERVFERGDIDDIRNCRRYYGEDIIRDALLNAKFLSLPVVYLAAAVVGRPLTDFKCYKPRQSNSEHWAY